MVRSRFLKDLAALAVLAAVYFLAGKLGLKLAFVNASVTAVWPCTGIALAAFLVLGYRVWPAILTGAFLVNLTTAGSVATSIRRPLQFASWRLLRPGELCMGLAHFHDSKHVSAA